MIRFLATLLFAVSLLVPGMTFDELDFDPDGNDGVIDEGNESQDDYRGRDGHNGHDGRNSYGGNDDSFIYVTLKEVSSWAYLISVVDSKTGDPTCMGLLLSIRRNIKKSDIGLTAAQCVCDGNGRGRTGLKALLGRYDPSGVSKHEVTYAIKEIICHADWIKSRGQSDDIGLFRFEKPAKFSPYVQPAKLVQSTKRPLLENERCTVYGWGSTGMSANHRMQQNSKKHNFPSKLQECRLRIASTCEYWWPDVFNRKNMICAIGEQMSKGAVPCSPWVGDYGGPIICAKEDPLPGIISKVLGIFSFTGLDDLVINGELHIENSDSEKHWTSVYTRLSAYNGWIDYWKGVMTKVNEDEDEDEEQATEEEKRTDEKNERWPFWVNGGF